MAHAILTSDTHRELRVRTERGAELGDAVMTALVVPDEFRRVQDEYPILFRLNHERDAFTPVALLGFETGENLFLAGDRWDARYIPMSIDIQPFLIGGAPDAQGDKQVHVDLGSPRIGAGEGMRVFDVDGMPTPYLEGIAEKLGALDAGWRASGPFVAALRRYELLEPFTLEVTLDDGATNRLVGYHIIDERRLAALDAAALGDLHAAGHLLPIFMAVASTGRINALVARRNRALRG
ncbi:SapC family protein [Sphingomonas sp.]|uniref:SapC family protein n=1 Tax=Sphingomonas sp. TaxID=28214 RepID=UPI0035C806CD